jgi:hypothetical protein
MRPPFPLLLQLRQLLGEPRYLRRQRLRRLLSIGRVKLAQIARNALLQPGTPTLHLRPREVLVPIVHGLELAAIDGQRSRSQGVLSRGRVRQSAPAQRQAIEFAEVRDRLVIRSEPAQ